MKTTDWGLPPHLVDLDIVKGRTENGALICKHDRQLSICRECAGIAEAAYLATITNVKVKG